METKDIKVNIYIIETDKLVYSAGFSIPNYSEEDFKRYFKIAFGIMSGATLVGNKKNMGDLLKSKELLDKTSNDFKQMLGLNTIDLFDSRYKMEITDLTSDDLPNTVEKLFNN